MKRKSRVMYEKISKLKRVCTIAQLVVVAMAAILQMIIKNFVINAICDPRNASIFTWASNRSDTKEILAFASGGLLYIFAMILFLRISNYKDSITVRFIKSNMS